MIYRCVDCGKRITEEDCGRCITHRREYRQLCNRNRKRQQIDRQYNGKWRVVRNLMIARYPLCLHCFMKGKYTPAVEVDHIYLLDDSSSEEMRLSPDNLAPLCKRCHTWKTYHIDPLFRNYDGKHPDAIAWIERMNEAKQRYQHAST